MRIVELRWRRYRIPFRRPVATAHGEMRAREGAIVEVVTDAGVTGVGEIAPLPQFGHTLEEALAPLPELAEATQARPDGDAVRAALAQRERLPSATRFGLETARLDAQAKLRGHSAHDVHLAVPVNATVAARAPDVVALSVHLAARRGYSSLKLKVGICDTLDDEVERIEAARDASPYVRLRLDANEAWTLDQAVEVLRRVAGPRIEYCEQPLARDDLDGMRRLRSEVPVAIAADEAVTDEASARRAIEAQAADVLVLKPQCLGGAVVCRRIVEMLPAGMGWVATSALEAGIGVTATLSIASMLPRRWSACGLATLDLLEDDLIVAAPRIEHGMMYVPQGPGLGVELDRAALAKYAVD
jgi:L-Ala-D/L-Glu epimerase